MAVSDIARIAAKKYKGMEGACMMALHDIQNECGYVSEENQKFLAEKLEVPLSQIYGIITFYNRFTTTPKGKYVIQVCNGTACHVKGADELLEQLKKKLKIDDKMTTKDGLFSLESVRCLGSCGLAPVMLINKETYAKVTPSMLDTILSKYMKKGGKA